MTLAEALAWALEVVECGDFDKWPNANMWDAEAYKIGLAEAKKALESAAEADQTLKHIRDLAEENAKGMDGYEQIAEWAKKVVGEKGSN